MDKIIDKPNFLMKSRKARNPLVRTLRTDDCFRMRVERSKKAYTRKEKYRAW